MLISITGHDLTQCFFVVFLAFERSNYSELIAYVNVNRVFRPTLFLAVLNDNEVFSLVETNRSNKFTPSTFGSSRHLMKQFSY